MADEKDGAPNSNSESKPEEPTIPDNIVVLSIVQDFDKGFIKIHHRPANTILALGMIEYARLKLEDELMNPMNQKTTGPKIVKPKIVVPGDIGRKQ